MSSAGECVPEEKLVAYLEGTLSPDEYAWVDGHINRCSGCQQTVDWMTEHLLQEVSRDSLLFPTTLEYGSDSGERGRDAKDSGQGLVPTILAQSDAQESLGKLNEYEVLRILGRGGYGIVFEALDTKLNRHVAIKVLLPGLATHPISRRRFIREARAGAAINHPNVVTIHGVEDSDRVPFLVMELLRGKSLRDRLHGEPKLGPLDIIRISMQVAQGLAAAHAQGIVHRDVKPGNIMLVDGLNRVKITDFGLARVVVEKMELTVRGIALGTPGYMSPEQVRGEELDTRSDLFSLGCVIHAMFTGHSPFHGRTVLEIARRVDADEPPRLRDLEPSAPEFMDALVHRLLRKNPDDRYPSAAEVADVLNRHLAFLNQTPTDRLPLAWEKPIVESGMVERSRSWGRWLAIGVATLVGGIFLSFYLAWPGGTKQTDSGDENGPSDTNPPSMVRHERQLQVTVSQDDSGDFRTIHQALRNIAPGGTITVLDSAIYAERLNLVDSKHLTDVHLEAPRQAVLQFESAEPLINIESLPRFRLSGFRLVVPQAQMGVVIRGYCPGLVLSDLVIERIPNRDGMDLSNGGIALRSGASGSEEDPLQLRQITMLETNVGLVIGTATTHDLPVRHVLVEGCRIQGYSRQSSTLIAMIRRCENVVIRHNLLWGGITGLSFLAEEDASPQRCQLEHNSWFDTESWVSWDGPLSPMPMLVIRHNLVVDSLSVAPSARAMTHIDPPVFFNNLAVNSNGQNDEELSPWAVIRNDFPLLSLDPEHPDFLKPDYTRLKEIPELPNPLPGVFHNPAP